MANFRGMVRCPVCKSLIEQIGFLAQGGHWSATQKCDKCRYQWTAKQSSKENVIEALQYGGDDGILRVWPDGLHIGWRVNTGLLRKGQIIAYVSPGVDANIVLDELPEGEQAKGWQRKFRRRDKSSLSHNRRYLVRVPRETPGGKELKSWYYAPAASTLENGERAVLIGRKQN